MRYVCLLAAALFAFPASATLLVTSASDAVNGDTSSADALILQPGSDGISLREALLAARSGPIVIEFAPSLAGTTISLLEPLPVISRAGVVVRADPRVTITGAQQQRFGGVFLIAASNVVLSGLVIEHVAHGAAINIDASLNPAAFVRDVVIEDSVFRHTLDGAGAAVFVTTGSKPKSTVQHVTIARNRMLEWRAPAIEVLSSADGGTVNDVLADQNEIEQTAVVDGGSGLLIGTGDHSVGASVRRVAATRNRFTGLGGERNAMAIGAAGMTAAIADTLLYGNEFRACTYPIEVTSTGRQGETARTNIIANRFTANVHPVIFTSIGIDSAHPATGNRASDVLISSNTFFDNRDDGTILQGGWRTVTSGNRVEQVRIVNNLFVRNGFASVVINGGGDGAEDNTIDGVLLTNNTIVQQQSNGIAINSNLQPSLRNAVRNVRLVNTIVAANPGVPFPGESPQEIRSSTIDHDPLFRNSNADDYELQLGSPAIDSAAVDAAPPGDNRCRARTALPDQGALEFGSEPRIRLARIHRGSGDGHITPAPGGVTCERIAFASIDGFLPGTVVAMTAIPASGSIFTGWSGDADCHDGTVTLTSDTLCTALFEKLPPRRRAVRISGIL